MKKIIPLCIALVISISTYTSGQGKALTFKEAEDIGIPFQDLDKVYKSAVHSDTTLAVFKLPAEQVKLEKAYIRLIQDLGLFLKKNNFKWEQQTRCFNRIYFEPDGRIDYFLFNFPANHITSAKEKEFARLLSIFINNYTFSVTASEKFAQCSPISYSDL